MRVLLAATLLSPLLLAACNRPDAPAPSADAPAPGAPDNPVADVPPATAPQPAVAAEPTAAVPPVGGRPAPGTLTFAGFGPATFGSPAEQVRMAWGRELEGAPSEPDGCHYLVPVPRGEGQPPVAFMVEGGRFVRVDVTVADVVAPGGGAVGMDATTLAARYPGATSGPHKYVEGGRTLRVVDAAQGAGALVFELDAAGRVTEWRVGVPPQVDYVEGCS